VDFHLIRSACPAREIARGHLHDGAAVGQAAGIACGIGRSCAAKPIFNTVI
jgi:hypothetical protein